LPGLIAPGTFEQHEAPRDRGVAAGAGGLLVTGQAERQRDAERHGNVGADCRNERFVFSSSIAVYGAAQTPMSEDTVPEPEDPYGIGKYAVELDLRAAQRMFGLDYTIFRPHNVYGELQNLADPYRNVIGIFLNQLLSGRPMTIFGDGLQTRAFTHIDDVAPVIARSIDVPEAANEVFNVGADTPHTVLDLAHAVAKAFDVAEPEIEFLPARKEVVHAFSDHEKLHSIFGREPTVSLEEGLRRMAEWVHEAGVREPVRFESVEVLRNLPPSWAAGSCDSPTRRSCPEQSGAP